MKTLEICFRHIYLNIRNEFDTSVSTEIEIRQQIKNVRKSSIPELKNFDEGDIAAVSFVD